MHDAIEVVNARVHNLKGVSLAIPREKLVVLTGVSGSGKSSLVFDTLHTEAQRQLVETFSTFARRRLPKLSRPDVDEIRNLSTSIVIDQKRLGRTLRSTVGTATEVTTYLRMLYARCGSMPGIPSFLLGFNHPEGMCPACAGLGKRVRVNTEMLIDPSLTLRQGAITHPDWRVGAWNWRELTAIGLFDVDTPVGAFSEQEMERLLRAESIPIEKPHGGGTYAKTWRGVARRLERAYVDKGEDEPAEGQRDAYQRYFELGTCDVCGGLRLNPRALAVTVDGVGIGDAVQMALTDLDTWLTTLHDPIADPLVAKMRRILAHLIEIGVGYLSLNRSVATLSGGEVCFSGTFEAFRRSATRTAVLMRAGPSVSPHRRRAFAEVWQVRGARANNLMNVDVDIPQGVLVAVTGVAGSGKSSLVHDEFVARHPGAIVVDQTAIGRSSRSNPATYLGVFDVIRRHFAAETGESAALFSFNSKGACPTCKGQGRISIEMSFLDDVNVTCSDCGGRRYTDEALAFTWRNLSIHDVLSLTAREALDVFEHPTIRRPLTLLCEVGLDYLTLGQPLSTLSGGESQRIKLVTELGKSGNLYVLDEPTTGLHMADVERLMAILNRLVDDGNSVVIIEHNLDVIAQADWVIDLGPEGGDAGGRLVAAGTPEMIAAAPESHTGRYLAARLRTTRGAGAPAYRVDENPLAG